MKKAILLIILLVVVIWLLIPSKNKNVNTEPIPIKTEADDSFVIKQYFTYKENISCNLIMSTANYIRIGTSVIVDTSDFVPIVKGMNIQNKKIVYFHLMPYHLKGEEYGTLVSNQKYKYGDFNIKALEEKRKNW